MPEIKKILIANRGEIAVRIMRTCRTMGIKTVAVFSDPDRNSLHVRFADEAIALGGEKSAESYLVMDKIIDAVKKSGADAIHPGYGFLSENPVFADRCEKEGIIFIGPKAHSMRMMGDKTTARKSLEGKNVPLAPGTKDAIENISDAKVIADKIGYPILIKASAGGGGKGMRIVHHADDFEKSMTAAQNEAQNAFGDSRVYIEKYLENPRHIEFQILADQFGETVYLFERECSIQRRHQKVVEEAPSSILTPEMRKEMGEAAVKVATTCQYIGAGTVEFLVDKHLNFFFLEMNTRLQVEHPVTEMITGLDLVREQIRVANGEPLGYQQNDLTINGHAMEIRVYAEDPFNQFLPDIGKVFIHRPPSGYGVRVDAGIEEGMSISMFYDPMISKLITWDKDRTSAIQRMKTAIQEYSIVGVQTTLPFCEFVMNHDAFISGKFDTHFIQNYFNSEVIMIQDEETLTDLCHAGLNATIWLDNSKKTKHAISNSETTSGAEASLWYVRRK